MKEALLYDSFHTTFWKRQICKYRKPIAGSQGGISYKGMGNIFGLTDMFCLDCGGAAMTEFVKFCRTMHYKVYFTACKLYLNFFNGEKHKRVSRN